MEDTRKSEGNPEFSHYCWLLSEIYQNFCQYCCSMDGFDFQRHPLPLVFKGGEAFNKLKVLMTEAPVIHLADPNWEYIATYDASDFVAGVVLVRYKMIVNII